MGSSLPRILYLAVPSSSFLRGRCFLELLVVPAPSYRIVTLACTFLLGVTELHFPRDALCSCSIVLTRS